MYAVWKKKQPNIRKNKTSSQYLKVYDSLQFECFSLIPF